MASISEAGGAVCGDSILRTGELKGLTVFKFG